MRNSVLLAMISLWLAQPMFAAGPVQAELVMERDQFVPDEEIIVGVKISNRSGQTLHFGKDSAWVSLIVESRDGFPVAGSGELKVDGEFEVESATAATRRMDLSSAYRLSRPGSYRIEARVRIREGEWREEIATPTKTIHVFTPTKVFEQEFGIPRTNGGPPEVRKYILQQARFLNNTLQLYLRLTDASEGRIFLVQPLAPTLSINTPEVQIDRQSRLHVLNQIGRASFGYTVVDPDGRVLVRQVHEYTQQSRPRLKYTPEGDLAVVGGQRRVSNNDIPPPEPPKPIEVKKEGQ